MFFNHMKESGSFRCVVPDCKTRTRPGKRKRMHRFVRDPKRIELWLTACHRPDLKDKTSAYLYQNYRICSKHFETRMFLDKYTLHSKAVPTIFPQVNDNNASSQDEQQSCCCCHDQQQQEQHLLSKKNDEQKVLSTKGTSSNRISTAASTSFAIDEKVMGPATHSSASVVPSSPSVTAQTTTPSSSSSSISSSSVMLPTRNNANPPNRVRRTRRNRELITLSDFHEICDAFFPPELAGFIKLQSYALSNRAHEQRYVIEYNNFCLSVYFCGRNFYNCLKYFFMLPPKRSLQEFTIARIASCNPGIDSILFDSLKLKVDSMAKADKHCLLCMDEMPLKPYLYYDIGRDEVIGFENMGRGNVFKPAQRVLVFMLRGLFNKWKQPLAYFPVHSRLSGGDLKELLIEAIRKASSIGYVVETVISDLKSNFLELQNELDVTEDSPYFVVDGSEIIYMFDTPSLLIAFRNVFMKYTFSFDDGRTTSWEHIQSFYELDSDIRAAYKLTDSHLNPKGFEKKKVSLAAHVISHKVLSFMYMYVRFEKLPAEAIGTVELIEKFNKLFDVLNSRKVKVEFYEKFKRVFIGAKYQQDYLRRMCYFIEKLKVFNANGTDITHKMKSIRRWIVTINGIRRLWSKLKRIRGFQQLKTRKVNLDALRTLFKTMTMREGKESRLLITPIEFKKAFRKQFHINYFHKVNENCSNNLDTLLQRKLENVTHNFVTYGDITNEIVDNKDDNNIRMPGTTDYRANVLLSENNFAHICDYLMNKCLEIHSCDICLNFSKAQPHLDDSTIHFKLSEIDKSKYNFPNGIFSYFIYNLEKLFFDNVRDVLPMKGCGMAFFDLMKNVVFEHDCDHFPKEYLIKLFIRVRLFYTLKYANRKLKIGSKDDREIEILSYL